MRPIDADALDKILADAEIEARHNKRYVLQGAINTIRGNVAKMPTIEDQRWIPIAERKPEKHGRYLVSVYDHNRKCLDVGTSYFYPEINDFSSTNAYDDYYWEVTAWMERPEPYQEEKKRRKKKQ